MVVMVVIIAPHARVKLLRSAAVHFNSDTAAGALALRCHER